MLATLRKNETILCSVDVLRPSMIDVEINGKHVHCLLEYGASECLKTPKVAKAHKLKVKKGFNDSIALAYNNQRTDLKGVGFANLLT